MYHLGTTLSCDLRQSKQRLSNGPKDAAVARDAIDHTAFTAEPR